MSVTLEYQVEFPRNTIIFVVDVSSDNGMTLMKL